MNRSFVYLSVSIVLLILAACGPAPTAVPPTVAEASPTAPTLVPPTATEVPAQALPTATEVAAEPTANGVVEVISLAAALNRRLGYR